MALINRSIIAKSVFSISVVAITASVGFVGLAQADHKDRDRKGSVLASTDGYGGNGSVLQAAIAKFQADLKSATTKFEADITACVALNTSAPVSDRDDFKIASIDAASDFSSETANPTAFGNDDKFDRHFRVADANFQNRLDDESDNLVTRVETRELRNANRSAFRSCVATARKTYHNSIQTARTSFRNALHDIFHI